MCTSMTDANDNFTASGAVSEKRRMTPAFELEADFALVAERAAENPEEMLLPGIWVTEPMFDEDGWVVGRNYVAFYDADEVDEGGRRALFLGSRYYREAMTHQDADERDVRIDCFKAAEMFYLHAAKRGNAQAYANLGYIYSYDRCEGDYWPCLVLWMSDYDIEAARRAVDSFDCDRRAYECYLKAAEAGVGEACYKVGDLLSWGRGCAHDADAAFQWFRRGFDIGLDAGDELVSGAAALRLGQSFEEGAGCEQDFKEALAWYRIAAVGLQLTVAQGCWYYESSLKRACDGKRRMMQEIDGSY